MPWGGWSGSPRVLSFRRVLTGPPWKTDFIADRGTEPELNGGWGAQPRLGGGTAEDSGAPARKAVAAQGFRPGVSGAWRGAMPAEFPAPVWGPRIFHQDLQNDPSCRTWEPAFQAGEEGRVSLPKSRRGGHRGEPWRQETPLGVDGLRKRRPR